MRALGQLALSREVGITGITGITLVNHRREVKPDCKRVDPARQGADGDEAPFLQPRPDAKS
jgi:hypothetical protein